MNEKVNSNKIKTALMHNFIFVRGYIGGTEISVPFGIADCLFIKKKNPTDIIEIEIKISKADILNEFKCKHNKHFMMDKEQEGRQGIYNTSPNKYYFCVPEELVDFTKEILTKYEKTKYGIISYKEVWRTIKSKKVRELLLEESIQIVKSALNIRPKEKIDKEVIEEYKRRIELRNVYFVNTLMRQVYFNLDKASRKIYKSLEE
jgi:hypothetical protein